MKHPIVVREPGHETVQGIWQEEPVFWPTHSHLALPGEVFNRLAEYLCCAVARVPSDLTAHTQRLLLHVQRRDPEALYGALLDLFIALDDKDPDYRAHMLERAASLLEPGQLAALRAQVQPHGAADPAPHSPWSVLSRGLTGTTRVVIREDAAPSLMHRDEVPDVMKEARDLIDSGRVAEAQKLLERTLLKDPSDQRLAMELVELYHHTRDQESFRAMHGRLAERSPEAAETWTALAALFSVD